MDNTYSVDTWFERDRASIIVYKGNIGDKVIAEWWDEEVWDLVELGFLNSDNWKESAIEYCKHLGIIKE